MVFRLNLQTLEYFIVIAKEKSLSKAAEKLFISQPALTKQIKRLEELLGFSVFNRLSHGVTLTRKGEQFLKDIEPTINTLRFDVAKHMTNQTVKIGSDPYLATYYFPDFIGNTEPLNIHITKIVEDTLDLIPLMRSGEIDAAIIQDQPKEKGLISSWLYDDEFYAAIPESYDYANHSTISIDECLQFTQILSPSITPLYKRIKHLMDRTGQATPEIIEMPYHTLIGFVAQGAGISYLPSIMVRKINYKGVSFIPIKHAPLKRKMYLYASSNELLYSLKNVFDT